MLALRCLLFANAIMAITGHWSPTALNAIAAHLKLRDWQSMALVSRHFASSLHHNAGLITALNNTYAPNAFENAIRIGVTSKTVLNALRDPWTDLKQSLLVACVQGWPVQGLLALGVHPDVRLNHSGTPMTPVMIASRYGHLRTVRELLDGGASVDAVTDDGETRALHFAASMGNADVAHELLLYGADIDAPDEDGYTPLLRACKGGFVNAVRTLLRRGANRWARNHNGDSAQDLTIIGHGKSRDRNTILALLLNDCESDDGRNGIPCMNNKRREFDTDDSDDDIFY